MVEKQASTLVITLPAQRGGEVSLSGDHKELVEAADKLNRSGIVTVPDNADGNYRLLISGLKNANQLNELIGRPVTIKQSQTDDKKKPAATKASVNGFAIIN